MAKLLKLALLLIALIVVVVSADFAGLEASATQIRYGPGTVRLYECPSRCSRRCSRTQYHKPCMFFCQKCCRKCLCVPPGFYGNKGVCPCYNNWKTKRGGPKCP